MKLAFYSLTIVLWLAACTATKKLAISQPAGISIRGKLFASLYQQRAAEYHALCLQAYNLARWRLDELSQQVYAKPKAIITDIDETVLDNSAYAVHQALQGKDYEPSSWHEWTGKAEADTFPGALTFLKYASSKGMEIFYITNRDEQERSATLQNLQHFGFPNADNGHLQLRKNESGKEQRRLQVLADHGVILLLGDNLSDFSSLFDKKMIEERLQATQQQLGQFGNRFIVLPNPVYGDWESALYRYNYQLNSAQKDSVIRSLLKSY
jgi:5'-nucleotidase (lipoprotein e(P4) family)